MYTLDTNCMPCIMILAQAVIQILHPEAPLWVKCLSLKILFQTFSVTMETPQTSTTHDKCIDMYQTLEICILRQSRGL